MDGFNAAGRSGGGAGDCESCRMWGEHYYWNHMSDDKKQFLVVASGDFKDSMRIPREVGTHLRSMISESVQLDAPNGRIYHIGVCREMGELVLRSGWQDFVTTHHIEENYSILFVYLGNSSFKVHIFNSVGHEKPSSCSQPPPEIFGAGPSLIHCDHHVLNEEQVVPHPGHDQILTDFGYTMLPGCHLTKAQDEKVLEIAHTMRSEIPLYVAAMNKSNVNLKDCSVNIPLRLVTHFKEEITKATVQLEGPDFNIYNVVASKQSDDQIVLQSGWSTFLVSHHIQENDLLIFGSKGKTRLKVIILDPSGYKKTSTCFVTGKFSSTQEMCEDSVQIVDPPPHTVIELGSSDDDDVVGENDRKTCRLKQAPGRCAKTRKMASTSSPPAKPGYEAHKTNDQGSVELGVGSEPLGSNNLKGPFQRPYMLSQRVTLTWQVKMKVEERVQAIESELPIYVRVLTKSNVLCGKKPCALNFCTEYASACLPNRNTTLFLRLEGKEMQWPTTLLVHYTQYNIVRRIDKGWKVFVSHNGLEEGDICLFELTEGKTNSLEMTVHLIRRSEIEL